MDRAEEAAAATFSKTEAVLVLVRLEEDLVDLWGRSKGGGSGWDDLPLVAAAFLLEDFFFLAIAGFCQGKAVGRQETCARQETSARHTWISVKIGNCLSTYLLPVGLLADTREGVL